MVDAVNTVGRGTPVAPVGQQAGLVPASNTGVAAKAGGAGADTPAKTGSATSQTDSLLSRVYVDPTAGGIVVTAQIHADGSIAQEVPSAAVLAYLRDGLTIEGYPKQSTTA